MAASDANFEREQRKLRREQIREQELRSRDEDSWRVTQEALRRDEERQRQEAEEQARRRNERRLILEEEERRLEEEERQMLFHEENRRKTMEEQLSLLRRQRASVGEQRRQAQQEGFGDGVPNRDFDLSLHGGSEQRRSRRESEGSQGRTAPPDDQYESFEMDKTRMGGNFDESCSETERTTGNKDTTDRKRSISPHTPEYTTEKEPDFKAVLSAEIQEMERRLTELNNELTESVKRNTDREISKSETTRKSIKDNKGHQAKDIDRSTHDVPKKELKQEFEKDIDYQRRKEIEQAAQKELIQILKRQEKEMQEKEEKIRRMEKEMDEKERWLDSQEKERTPYIEELHEKNRQLDIRMAELQKRQRKVDEREAKLNAKSSDQARNRVKKIEPSESERQFTISNQCDKRYNKGGAEIEKGTDNTVRPKENHIMDGSLNFPKFSPFSGDESKPKSEATYEEWKYEVKYTRKGGLYSDELIAQAVIKSLRGQAKRSVMHLESSDLDTILDRLEGAFGNVATGEAVLMEFYTAFQQPEESVNSWGIRLEEILQKAIDKGHVKEEEKDYRLRHKFWRSLRSERLKNATRVQFYSIENFEKLRSAVRAEENEMKLNANPQCQPMRTQNKEQKETSEEDTKFNKIMKRLADMDSEIKELRQQQQERPKQEGATRGRPYHRYPRRPYQNRRGGRSHEPVREEGNTETQQSGN